MGLVAYHGKWDRPEVVGQEIQNDPAHQAIVKEYLDRRARTPDTAEAQMKLAAWCEEKGLKEQAIAHYTAVTRIDPSRDAAWKHLGYKKQGNRWVKPEEAAAAKQEAARQKQADKHWKPRLEKLREWAGEQGRRQAGEGRARADRGDRSAGGADDLGDFCARRRAACKSPRCRCSARSTDPRHRTAWPRWRSSVRSVRCARRAIETLKRRDPRDVVGRLIGLIHKPYKYQVRHVNGPGSPGELFVEGERFNISASIRTSTSFLTLRQTACTRRTFPLIPFGAGNLMAAMQASQFPSRFWHDRAAWQYVQSEPRARPASVRHPVRSGDSGHAPECVGVHQPSHE